MAGSASSIKMGGEGGGSLISPDGVAPSWIVGMSASDIFPCTMKSKRFLLAPAHPVVPEIGPLNGCVCKIQKQMKWI